MPQNSPANSPAEDSARPPLPGRFARPQDVERPGPGRREPGAEGRVPEQAPPETSGQAAAARHVRAVPPAPAVPQRDGRRSAEDPAGWLDPEQVDRFRAQWHSIQAGFVDDPRQAVEQADALVAKSAELVAEAVAERRRRLGGGDGVDGGAAVDESGARTEHLRLALRQYRTLLERLLAA
ncbi:hypothetical protein [Kitasatospora mediocidica]|uniref:hypothetical protein n=1 Tax=Kitasatospora mediocidica TaxID=58352 RepID=UPI00068A31FF|nr:hypothetical protein [Kitasatospora mediocidica]